MTRLEDLRRIRSNRNRQRKRAAIQHHKTNSKHNRSRFNNRRFSPQQTVQPQQLPFGLTTNKNRSPQMLFQQQHKPTLMSATERSYHDEPVEALVIDPYTTQMIRAVVLSCIADKKKDTTLYMTTRAILATDGVFELYTFLTPPSWIAAAKGWIIKHFLKQKQEVEDKSMLRRYELISCLEHIEKKAPSTPIHSWEDFKQATTNRMQFQEEQQDENNNNNWTMQIKLQNKAKQDLLDKNLRSFNQKLKAISLASTHSIIDTSSSVSTSAATTQDEPMVLDKADRIFAEQLQQELDKTMARRTAREVLEAEQKMRDQEEAEERQRQEEEARRLEEEEREREARERAQSLMRPMTEDEAAQVANALYGSGDNEDIIASIGPASVSRESIRRLQPSQWLNDEIIQFFLKCLANRDETMSSAQPGKARSHFVQSYFMSKLLDEHHSDPDIQGVYNYRNVKRWSKQAPGKDLFNLDKIFFPINQGGVHWVCAVVYMKEKKIQFYDSLHGPGTSYLAHIFKYLQDEHKAKKGTPLPNPDDWLLVECDVANTPRQLNGFDCGVFTCMFCDFLSKDCPITFGQEEITACRERIALSVLNRAAIM